MRNSVSIVKNWNFQQQKDHNEIKDMVSSIDVSVIMMTMMIAHSVLRFA